MTSKSIVQRQQAKVEKIAQVREEVERLEAMRERLFAIIVNVDTDPLVRDDVSKAVKHVNLCWDYLDHARGLIVKD